MSRRKTTEQFIIESKKIHLDEYDYNLIKYINAHTKVEIICKIHGVFVQLPHNHLRGFGCMKCYNNKKHSNIQEFIIKANNKHNNYYSYDDSVYINSKTDITILCHIHGSFKQLHNAHLKGSGCMKCGNNFEFKKY